MYLRTFAYTRQQGSYLCTSAYKRKQGVLKGLENAPTAGKQSRGSNLCTFSQWMTHIVDKIPCTTRIPGNTMHIEQLDSVGNSPYSRDPTPPTKHLNPSPHPCPQKKNKEWGEEGREKGQFRQSGRRFQGLQPSKLSHRPNFTPTFQPPGSLGPHTSTHRIPHRHVDA